MLAPSKTAYCMVARVGRSALHSASTHHGLGTRCRFHAFCGHVSITRFPDIWNTHVCADSNKSALRAKKSSSELSSQTLERVVCPAASSQASAKKQDVTMA